MEFKFTEITIEIDLGLSLERAFAIAFVASVDNKCDVKFEVNDKFYIIEYESVMKFIKGLHKI